MSQTNLNNVAEEVVTETVVPAVEDTTTETVAETVEAGETKRKSFFDIFKKKKSTVEEPTEAGEAAEEAPVETADAAEVPVEESTAKKTRLCGLCACGKKKEAEAPAETTEEPVTETPAEEVPAETTEAPVVAEEVVAPKEATPVVATEEPVATPVVAAATEEEPVSTEESAPEVSAVSEADIARSGLLHKSGKFLKSRLNARHCRLLHTGAFQWSKTEDFVKAHECMVCKDTTTVAFMAEGEDTEHKYRFELHCCKEVMTFACDTEEERDEWVRAFETVKEKVVPVEAETAEATETAEVAAE